MSPEDFERRFTAAVRELRQRLGRQPSAIQVARQLAIAPSTVRRWCLRLGMGTPARAVSAILS